MTDIHTLYWEVSGLATGEPVVVLHGGPGGGTDPDYRYIVVTNKVVGLVKLIVQGCIFSLKNIFSQKNMFCLGLYSLKWER